MKKSMIVQLGAQHIGLKLSAGVRKGFSKRRSAETREERSRTELDSGRRTP